MEVMRCLQAENDHFEEEASGIRLRSTVFCLVFHRKAKSPKIAVFGGKIWVEADFREAAKKVREGAEEGRRRQSRWMEVSKTFLYEQ